MFPRVLLAVFLAAHALIHTGFISPAPAPTAGGPSWPFDLGKSWLLSPLGLDSSVTHAFGAGLVALLVLGFGAAALATLNLAPPNIFVWGVVIGCVASLLLLVAFFNPVLGIGIALDLVLLWVVLLVGWAPDGPSTELAR